MTFKIASLKIPFIFILLFAGLLECLGQSGWVENKGQWNDSVRFRRQVPGAILYLLNDRISVLQFDDKQWSELISHHHEPNEKNFFKSVFGDKKHEVNYHHFTINFPNANFTSVIGENAAAHHLNFFLNDISVANVNVFRQVRCSDIYPGIDLVIDGESSGLKYNFEIQSPGNISDIKLRYDHINSSVLESDSIAIKTSLGKFYESIPVAYIKNGSQKIPVVCRFINQEINTYGFECSSRIESSQTLIIDPEVVFATYAGNSADNFGFTATYDESGHLYAGGITTAPDMNWNTNGRYPATTGAFSVNYNGGLPIIDYEFPCDITLSKYSPDGKTLLYATYLGGESNEYPHSIVVDKWDQLTVFGTSFSSKYPTTANAIQQVNHGMSDIVITKFSSDGSSLLGSTYLGGTNKDGLNEANVLNYFYADNFRGEVITDTFGNIYAASTSQSTDFPLKNAVQSEIKGQSDGVFLMLNSDLSKLEWSSYLGGNLTDALYSVDLDSSGRMYMSGGTRSANLPKSEGKIGTQYKGGPADGFIAILDPSTKELVKTAFWGGSSYDQIFSLEIDFENKIYVVGQTLSDMPIVGNVYNVPRSGQFISKFDQDLNNIEFSTVFGSGDGRPDITINAFLVDECRKIFVSGWGGKTSSNSFSDTYRLPVTSDAYQDTTDGSDFYLMVLSKQAKELLYATFFGGSITNDHVDGGTSRFDKKGVIYQSVCASCPRDDKTHAISDFPTTPGSFAEKNISPRCSNASFKIAFGNLNRPPNLEDKTLRVRVLDTLFNTYNITDPDDDSLFVTMTPDAIADKNLVKFNAQSKALSNWAQSIGITAGCENIGDTMYIEVYAIDKGCPAVKDSTATIQVIVDPPPILDPPKDLCLNFIDDSGVKLFWDPIESNKYFQFLTLFRINPNGDTLELRKFTNTNGISYSDFAVTNPKKNEYIYFVTVTNICGQTGPKSYFVSTTKEFEFPIEVTYLVTATVNNSDEVEIFWAHSTETDFGYYDIYRKENSDKFSFEYLGSTYSRMDTVFVDKDVKVGTTSYCYVIVVHDNCGHVSKYSNRGCTIVLEGTSKPFEHDIFWNEYEDWDWGVESYTLSRSVDTGSLRPLISTGFDERFYWDTTFDYNWGGYYYRVKAFENPGGFNALSQSNKIYLIQPPLLHVPNAFTPNGDGLNEFWGIVPVFVKTYHLQVFDRWGERVYDSDDKLTDWDGFYKNTQVSNSVYIYTITFTGWDRSVHHRKGTVTIIK